MSSLEIKEDGLADGSGSGLEKLDLDVVTVAVDVEVASTDAKVGWMSRLATWGVEERGLFVFFNKSEKRRENIYLLVVC